MTAVPQYTAAALIAAGLVLGGSTVAHATDSPYVTVAWSYPGYPDMAVPQPFIASTPGANLHAFDSLAASPWWCGKPIQVDVYQRTDKHGVSWESLKSTGALLNGHDGGYLAYNAGIGTPYRVITTEEYPCTQPTETPTTAPTTPAEPSSSPTPTAFPSPTSSATPKPSPTSAPTSSPTPTVTPTSSPTPSAPATAPIPTGGTTPPDEPTAAPSGPSHATPAFQSPKPSSITSPTSTATPVAAATSTPDELAYTGANPWPGLSAAALLLTAGTTLLIARARKAAKR
jgi:hypothetical protein